MKNDRRRSRALALTIVGIALAGTQGYAAPHPQRSAGEVSAGSAAGAVPTPRSLLSVSAAKPVAPIAIEYQFASQPQLGVPFGLQISAASRDGIDELALTVHPDDGLVAGTPQLTTGVSESARCSWTVTATAFKEGTLYLGVLVQGTVGDQHPSRNLMIPIRIGTTGSTPPTAPPQATSRSSIEQVIVLPSEPAP